MISSHPARYLKLQAYSTEKYTSVHCSSKHNSVLPGVC